VRVIAHVSDLHFGRVGEAALQALHDAIGRLGPDLVVVSGDLTQRAKAHQFQQARQFLDSLFARRILVVPGNHDVPLYNILARWLTPLDKYRKYVESNLFPTFADREIAVMGLSTARSLTIKDGRLNRQQMDRACAFFAEHQHKHMRILVTHHPFDVSDRDQAGDIVQRSRQAVARFSECGLDMILSGHLHGAHVADSAQRYGPHSKLLLVQAGTATSTRLRHEQNSWNLIRIDKDAVSVEVMASADGAPFAPVRSNAYLRGPDGWEAISGSIPPLAAC
jgi:3',5'-cyclic AMP phosphodiesterase CpdA